MRVEEREELPKVGERIRDTATGLHYDILECHGKQPHRIPCGVVGKGRQFEAEVFTVQYVEDGLKRSLSLFQMYTDEYAGPEDDLRKIGKDDLRSQNDDSRD